MTEHRNWILWERKLILSVSLVFFNVKLQTVEKKITKQLKIKKDF